MALQVVWFKRDLRLHDHRPLVEAAQRGPVLPLYVAEPELWQRPDSSARQWNFCREALQDLNEALTGLGQPLVVRVGEVVAVLEAAHRRHGIGGLWSHQETGNLWTYERDRKVAAWANDRGIPWRECASFGVIRGLKDRRGWARAWEQRMAEPLLAPPAALPPPWPGSTTGACPVPVTSLWRRTPARRGSVAAAAPAGSCWRGSCGNGDATTTAGSPVH